MPPRPAIGVKAGHHDARVLDADFLGDDVLELIDEVVEIPGGACEERVE